MKKIGQKLSFLTKIMLVIGLLISNLSSLSVVFAYETSDDMVVTLTEELLEISYNQELAEEVEAVDVRVYENYTYSDGVSEDEVENVYSLSAEELLAAKEGTLELTYNSMFVNEEEVNNFELFDGLYKVRVEIVDVTDYTDETTNEVVTETEIDTQEVELNSTEVENTEEQILLTQEEEDIETVLAVATYEKEMLHESGLNIRLFNEEGTEIVLVDGKYPVSVEDSNVIVVAQILSGGLNPDDVYEYDGVKYSASELLGVEFSSEESFEGYLFGEYELPVEAKVNRVLPVNETTQTAETTMTEEVVYTESINVLYESYELNAYGLNMITTYEGYGEAYMFYSDSKEGVLYVLSEIGEAALVNEETVVTRTMLDLYNILNAAFSEEDEKVEPVITYTLLKNGVNVLESFVPAGEEDTIENYLSTIMLDDTVQVVIENEGLTITYDVVLAADLDNDNVITTNDVLELINQVVGESEITDVEKSDLYGFDGEINSLDVLYLNQVVKTQVWNAEITDEEVSLNASLDVKLNGEALSEENYLISGDEFTVDYVLSLTDYEVNGIAGLFNYDKSLFELVSVEVINEWLGNVEDGKFLYLGEESLTGSELDETETELPEEENTDNQGEVTTGDEVNTNVNEEVVTADYVVVTARFKALKATNEEDSNVITLEEIELFNSTEDGVTYYVLDTNEIATAAINVVVSDDNTLSYLEVAGQKITLEDGVYEYEITVENDVTAVDLKYILGNVAANVTSTVYPEELAEGSNTIVVTVTSESGVSQDYTITVVREEAPEETTTQVNYSDNYYNDDDNEEEEVVVTPGTTEEDNEEEEELEEESNLSRIIIIILILLVIAGLVYLIFKDEDDEETKKTNKEINKLKKEVEEPEVKTTVNKTVSKNTDKVNSKTNSKSTTKSNNSGKNKKNSNNKKER